MLNKILISICSIIISLSACNQKNEENNTRLALLKTTNPAPKAIDHKKDLAERVEHEIEAFDEIYDVAVIQGKKKILVAYKVKHLDRFQMKKIEKKINKKLEDQYPKDDFIISSDYKIFLETVKLINKMNDPKFSEKKANKRLNEIIELKKELT